ncbi:hypothetical protein GCM10009646_32820 [Streptomyces aureus]
MGPSYRDPAECGLPDGTRYPLTNGGARHRSLFPSLPVIRAPVMRYPGRTCRLPNGTPRAALSPPAPGPGRPVWRASHLDSSHRAEALRQRDETTGTN